MTQPDSIPAEWISTIAQAIHDADEAGAPMRAIAKTVITILRPLIEAETRAKLAGTFNLPISDCGDFVAGEIGPDCFTTPDGNARPKYGVIVWYEAKDITRDALVAACEAHWPSAASALRAEGK